MSQEGKGYQSGVSLQLYFQWFGLKVYRFSGACFPETQIQGQVVPNFAAIFLSLFLSDLLENIQQRLHPFQSTNKVSKVIRLFFSLQIGRKNQDIVQGHLSKLSILWNLIMQLFLPVFPCSYNSSYNIRGYKGVYHDLKVPKMKFVF